MGIYENGIYARENPSWHAEDSPWKARHIVRMLDSEGIQPKTICEIGCGAGEILSKLADMLPCAGSLRGYEISPQAYDLCKAKSNGRIQFKLADPFADELTFDLLLAIDVIEHVEDYFSLLRKMKTKADFKLFHVPLDLSVQTVLRGQPLLYVRKRVGHLHYFTRETFLASLEETGYQVRASFFTATAVDLPVRSWLAKWARIPRVALNSISASASARILGGSSLLVLAR